jgi:predicted nucleic acid-binding protein
VSTSLVRVVVTDSNALINLMHVARLELLGKIPGHEFVIPDHVYGEITEAGQRAQLDRALKGGWLKLEAITDLDAIALFTELIAHIGRGEAACIAIATKHGWSIASDEKRRFRREAEARVGSANLLGTVDIFVLAIKAGLLSIAQADADKLVLESRKFKVSFASFSELVK